MIHYQQKIRQQIVLPAMQFINQEKSGGIVLGLAVVLALVLANSPLRFDYAHFLHHHFGFVVDGQPCLNFTLEHWINDGLMSMFFFVVGLEGMVFPALIYLVFNGGTPVAHGWGIPMATDIAFALAVVYLLGDRVPVSAKVFLTTLAIVDDLGSVLVIALFYTSQLSMVNLLVGLAFLLVMFVGNKMGVKSIWFYGILGIGGVWTAFLLSGIHATIAAVLSAMVIPADSQISEDSFVARMRKLTRRFDEAESNGAMRACRLSTWIWRSSSTTTSPWA